MTWCILRRKLLNYMQQLAQSEFQHRYFTRNLTKVLFAALKDKKALTTIMKEKLCFKQLRSNYLNNNKRRKRTLKISYKLY